MQESFKNFLIGNLAGIIVAILLTYIPLSYISLTFNPLKWYLGCRIALGAIVVFLAYYFASGIEDASNKPSTFSFKDYLLEKYPEFAEHPMTKEEFEAIMQAEFNKVSGE